MGLQPINSYSPLLKGLVFGGIIFAFALIKEAYKAHEITLPIFVAAFVGGLVGGVIYGLISKFRNR
jgi:hypothetical protein